MATIADLVTALENKFAGTVTIYENVPSTIPSPAVIIAPGEPFLTTIDHGRVEERWQVLVTAKITGPDRGTGLLRKNSLKVREALNSTGGALWLEASQPAVPNDGSSVLVVVNEVAIRYAASEILDDDESS